MRIKAAVLTTMLVLVSGCGDVSRLPTTPVSSTAVPGAGQGQLLGEVVDELTRTLVAPLHRTSPLSAPVSWSFVVGPNGATSTNSAAGLTISVPRGALKANVTITVTALEGSEVAYRFQPHGLKFEKSVTLTQSLSGIKGGLLSDLFLVGAHFQGDEPKLVNGLAVVDEIVGAQLNLLRTHMSFPITHFSGWIMASGRSGDSEE
jgi:hypothetical protein